MIDLYTRPEFARLWSDEHRYEVMLEVEILVCEALARRGIVPEDAVKVIREKASVDVARVDEIEA